MQNKWFIFIPVFIVFLSSCQSEEEKKLEAMDFQLKVNRIDIGIENFTIALKDSSSHGIELFEKYIGNYKNFIKAWNYDLGDSIVVPDSIIALDFISFCSDKSTKALIDTVRKTYPKDFPFEKMLEKPMKRLKLYFSDFQYPEVYTYVTGYPPAGAPAPVILERDQLLVSEKYWGISLDYFLGTDADYHIEIPMYMRKKCRKEYILPAILNRMVYKWMPPLRPEKMPNFSDRMIHHGIRMYFVRRIAPELQDSIILSYTPQQMEWVKGFEKNIYNELLPYFFKTDPKANEKYLIDRPFTSGLDRESPGRLGEFLGYQIVKKYMENHPEVTLEQLVKTEDYQKILKESKYKP